MKLTEEQKVMVMAGAIDALSFAKQIAPHLFIDQVIAWIYKRVYLNAAHGIDEEHLEKVKQLIQSASYKGPIQ